MKLLYIVMCFLNLSAAYKDTYRAAIVHDGNRNSDLNGYIPAIYEAGRANVDILVLPSSDTNSEYNYDEAAKNIAKAARQASVYVVAHLHEKVRCNNKNEMIRSNLVFNREGTIVSVYRKPVNSVANCTIVEEGATFTTDFGVLFGHLMEEDLALKNPLMMNAKNFIVTGSWPTEISFLSARQFVSPWSFVMEANVLSYTGIYPNAVVKHGDRLIIADLNKNGQNDVSKPPVTDPSELQAFPGEDLSQYIVRPLDVEASRQGYKETVCHKKFCCEFYIKSNFKGAKSVEMNYGLAAFDGVRHYGRNRYIGTQSCALFACAGLYKRSCDIGTQNSTDTIFNQIKISGNFTNQNAVQYPMIVSSGTIKDYSMDTKVFRARQVTIKVQDSSLLSFGIFGRDFSRDHEAASEDRNMPIDSDFYGLLYNENVQEFIDYLWIRLRILIFVVSIYILEMM